MIPMLVRDLSLHSLRLRLGTGTSSNVSLPRLGRISTLPLLTVPQRIRRGKMNWHSFDRDFELCRSIEPSAIDTDTTFIVVFDGPISQLGILIEFGKPPQLLLSETIGGGERGV